MYHHTARAKDGANKNHYRDIKDSNPFKPIRRGSIEDGSEATRACTSSSFGSSTGLCCSGLPMRAILLGDAVVCLSSAPRASGPAFEALPLEDEDEEYQVATKKEIVQTTFSKKKTSSSAVLVPPPNIPVAPDCIGGVFAPPPTADISPDHHDDLDEELLLLIIKMKEEELMSTTITKEEIRLTGTQHRWSEKTGINSGHKISTKTASGEIKANKESSSAPSRPRKKYTTRGHGRRLRTSLKIIFNKTLETIHEAEEFHSDTSICWCCAAYKKTIPRNTIRRSLRTFSDLATLDYHVYSKKRRQQPRRYAAVEEALQMLNKNIVTAKLA
jgi:hypothetical protein